MPTAPRLTSIYFALQDNSGRAHIPSWWGRSRWDQEITAMKNLGINTIIFTAAVTCRVAPPTCPAGTPVLSPACCAAAYNTSIPALANVSSNFLENGMAAAARGNMSALIAPYLGTNLNPRSPASLNAGATAMITIIRDLNKTFGAAPKGYYIAQECGNDDPKLWYSVTSETARTNWAHLFWGRIANHIKTLSPTLTMSVAPYYFDQESDGGAFQSRSWVPLPQWAEWFDAVLPVVAKHSPTKKGIDTIYYQDGRGSFNTPSKVVALYKTVGKVVRKHGTAFWADIEIWRRVNETNRTWAGADKVYEQLRQLSPYVDGFTAWEWRQYLSKAGTRARVEELDGLCVSTNSSLTHYNDYYRYVLNGEPRLRLISANAKIVYSYLPPTNTPKTNVPAGRLTDGNVFSPPSENLAWVLSVGNSVSLTLDLRWPYYPSNFRLFMQAHFKGELTVSVLCSLDNATYEGCGYPSGYPSDMKYPIADDITGMQEPWPTYSVRTYDLLLPIRNPFASVEARFVRFTVYRQNTGLEPPAWLNITQVEVYE